MTLSLATAFAAPLMAIIDWPTFIIVLYGVGKAGKSTAAPPAAKRPPSRKGLEYTPYFSERLARGDTAGVQVITDGCWQGRAAYGRTRQISPPATIISPSGMSDLRVQG